MANNNDDVMDIDSAKGSIVLERERRKRLQIEDTQQESEERFKREFAKALAEAKNSVAKEIRDAVDRSERGESWYKKRTEGFVGMGVKPDEV